MSPLRLVIFLAAVTGLLAALHRYVWVRLVRDVELPRRWARVATVAIVVLAILPPVALPLGRALPRAVMRPLAFVAYGWLGILFLLVVSLAITDLVRLARAVALRLREDAEPDPSRRRAVRRAFAAVAGVVAAGTSAWGVGSVLRAVEVRRHRVSLRRLPAAFDGLTIAQITDLHVGPLIGRDYVESVVARTNAIGADLIAITGDLVDGSVEELREHVAPLAKLRAPLGVFFVTGNHEYYSGVEAWVAHLRSLGVRVLRNERVELRRGDDVVELAGVEDFSARSREGRGHDMGKALAGVDPSRELILLAHQPRSIVEAARHGVGLQISGHTHGGQIVPFNVLVHLQQPYVVGLHRHEASWIYVSPGTGYWGPPMRVGVPAEITHLVLERSA